MAVITTINPSISKTTQSYTDKQYTAGWTPSFQRERNILEEMQDNILIVEWKHDLQCEKDVECCSDAMSDVSKKTKYKLL